jgi:ribosomal protein S18 acetylase RimI-like enzyme
MPEVVVPLTVRDLTDEDLPACGWSGIALADRAGSLERARRGEVDYLAVCPPSGVPVATGGVDYTKPPGAATLWQLSVDTALRSCGIGTILIHALEQRIRARGLRWAELGVDENDSRPRALYERLGYVAHGREPAGWDEEAPDGTITRYETMIVLLRKELQAAS